MRRSDGRRKARRARSRQDRDEGRARPRRRPPRHRRSARGSGAARAGCRRRGAVKARAAGRRSRRSSRRSSPRRRATPAGSTRSSSTATACSPASTATTFACSRAAATTGPRSCARWSQALRGARRRPGLARRRDRRHRRATARPTSTPCRTRSTQRAPTTSSHFVFDLPYCAGHDLRAVPLVERRARARRAARRSADAGAGPLQRRTSTRAPQELLQHACRMRPRGNDRQARATRAYVSRRSPTGSSSSARSGRSSSSAARPTRKGSRTGIGSLLLGIHDEAGALRFAGSVGTGFDQKTLRALKRRSPRSRPPKTPFFDEAARRARPLGRAQLVAEVSFGEWTPDGRIRHSVFHGLRDDKDASAIGRERAVAPAGAGAKAKTRGERGRGAPTKRRQRRRDGRRHSHQPPRSRRRHDDRHHQARDRQLLPRRRA